MSRDSNNTLGKACPHPYQCNTYIKSMCLDSNYAPGRPYPPTNNVSDRTRSWVAHAKDLTSVILAPSTYILDSNYALGRT